jgi:acetyl/propionyl-CoA carboxylase alpha subunit
MAAEATINGTLHKVPRSTCLPPSFPPACLPCLLQIRGIKTNIPFMENVLRHPVFLNGAATTGFIETYSKELFKFEGHSNIRANKLLLYLADMVSRWLKASAAVL